MPRLFKLHIGAKGSMPGSLVFVGEQKQEKVRIRVMCYDSNTLEEKECESIDEAFGFIQEKKLTWINIDGLHDPEIVERIGERFNVHGLLLEDILNTQDRPKFYAGDRFIFVLAKMLSFSGGNGQIESNQLSILAEENTVITFQEKVGSQFDPVRERIRHTPNKVRLIRADYLTYALLDSLADHYIEIMGQIANRIDDLENEVMQNPTKHTAGKIYRHRSEMNFLRKVVLPTKEITLGFLNSDSELMDEKTRDYVRDLNDHVIVLSETIDAYQTIVMDQMNMYNAHISNRANEIMKTLTIFASLFIPMTFVAGIYGMNFKFIPELSWHWGYLFFWGLILLLGGGLLIYFRRKKWL